MGSEDCKFLRAFPSGIMNRRKVYLNEFCVILSALLECARDGRIGIDTFFFRSFFEIGIDFNRRNVGFYEFQMSGKSLFSLQIVSYFAYFDIGIVCIDLVPDEFGKPFLNDEEKSDYSVDIGNLKTEFRSGIGLVKKSFMLLKCIMKNIQNLLRHKYSLFIEAIDGYFEDGFFCRQRYDELS